MITTCRPAGRFNERLVLSLASNPACILMDDELNILPTSSHVANIKPLPRDDDGARPATAQAGKLAAARPHEPTHCSSLGMGCCRSVRNCNQSSSAAPVPCLHRSQIVQQKHRRTA